MRRKISQQYCGPFEIIGITGSNRFKLAIPPALKLYDEFEASVLRPFVVKAFSESKTELVSNPGAPPSIVPIDDDRLTHDEFYIEKILAQHYTKKDMAGVPAPLSWPRAVLRSIRVLPR